MNTRSNLRITTILFFLIIVILSLKSQHTLAQKDTTKVILVVRPGQNTYAKASNNSSLNTAQSYTAAIAFDTLNTNSRGSSANAPMPSTTQTVKSHRHGAPTLSERAGRPTYMDPPEKNTDTAPVTITTTVTSAPIIPAPVIVKKTDVQSPVKINTVIKKDTVYVHRRDTIYLPPKKHTSNKILFAEIGGPGLAISLNYDQRFSNQKDGWGYRVGMGYFGDGGNTVFTVPLQINYLVGSKGKYFEFGGGTTFLNSTGDNTGKTFIFDRVTGFIGTATIGVRYEPEKSLNFRIGFVPIFSDEGVIYAGGFSVGYTF
jgi:hypothetical protein